MELGGVGRGWALAGTLLAATAAKLSRPEGFGISRAEDFMAAILLEDGFVRFSAHARHHINTYFYQKRVVVRNDSMIWRW
jgi:hypothetical protein